MVTLTVCRGLFLFKLLYTNWCTLFQFSKVLPLAWLVFLLVGKLPGVQELFLFPGIACPNPFPFTSFSLVLLLSYVISGFVIIFLFYHNIEVFSQFFANFLCK